MAFVWILLAVIALFLGVTLCITSVGVGMDGSNNTPFFSAWVACMKEFLGIDD